MISKVQFRLQFLVLLWGFTGVFGKLVTLSALPMVWYRVLIAAIAVFIYMKYKKIDFKVSKNTLLKLLGIGGIVGMHWFTFYLSIKVSNVSIALSTLSMGALFTAVLEPIFYRRKINLYEVLLAVVVSACVVVIFNASPEYKMGIIYGIICSFLSALFAVFNSRIQKDAVPTQVTFYEMIGGIITISLVMLFFQPSGFEEVFTVSWSNLGWLTLLGVIFTAYAQIESVDLFKYVSAYTMLLNVNLEPVYGIILASLIFGDSEQMTPVFYIATAVMVLSIVVNGLVKAKFSK
ncbi:EamA-like transporter family protein [Algoriella xinjiangensis]|uniref:EamA-like transporter family protein n=1 Tax=Algoriella xinjiangensis TaxID=684065 RepID=A0A1I4SIE4_9FLAO|nr:MULTISPECIES: EamA family transporter [Algoriella]MBO6212847.1 EamA family transporter [Algoriella sp.]SFM64090.1 EamA-like transporter family protein [Algoriella xinjiangensis]VDH16071.1 carboxylate/amino acid/amine transporter [Algoriella xinjiangensis]